MTRMEIGRVTDSYVDEEGYLRADVVSKRNMIKGVRVCGRPPVIGETVMVVDNYYALVPLKLPSPNIETSGAEFLSSTPEGSYVECNPYGVIISSGDLTTVLVSLLDDIIRLISRRLEIHNDAFSLETFYKEAGQSVFRLAGSCSTENCRSEFYDWFIAVEDDTIKIEKWNEKTDDRIRAYVHVKKDEIRIGVENKITKKHSVVVITESRIYAETVDENSNSITKVDLSPSNFNLQTSGSGGNSEVSIQQGVVSINSSQHLVLRSARIDLNP